MKPLDGGHVLEAGLRSRGVHLSATDFYRLVHDVIATLPKTGPRREGEPMSDELATYARLGAPFPPPLEPESAVVRGLVMMALLIAKSLSTAEVASCLAVGRSRVLRRLRQEHSLYGFHWGGRWRIPEFQFEAGQCLPHLDDVVNALPHSGHPLAVANWFTLPNVGLPDDHLGHNLTPREWLIAERSPDPLLDLAEHLG